MIIIIILLCDVTAPHQPRLDYQMWFAARAHYKHNHWILNLVYRLLTQQTEGLSLYRTRRHTFYNNKLITIIISQTTTMFCLMNVSGRSTYLSVHCRWQSVSCRSRSSVEQSSIACHFCPPLSILCCRLESHLFSLSCPAFWLFSHLYRARAEPRHLGCRSVIEHLGLTFFFDRCVSALCAVLELMGENPFPDHPPKFIRASLYKYHFTSCKDKSDETRSAKARGYVA